MDERVGGRPRLSDRIVLTNMRFEGKHGYYDWELKATQPFEVDVELVRNLQPAGVDDDLTKTVDYGRVYDIAKQIVESTSFRLLEALWRREFGEPSLFHHNERAGREPATIAQRGQCFFGELHTIRRIEKHQRERLHRVCRAEIGGITTVHLGNATEPERLDIVA